MSIFTNPFRSKKSLGRRSLERMQFLGDASLKWFTKLKSRKLRSIHKKFERAQDREEHDETTGDSELVFREGVLILDAWFEEIKNAGSLIHDINKIEFRSGHYIVEMSKRVSELESVEGINEPLLSVVKKYLERLSSAIQQRTKKQESQLRALDNDLQRQELIRVGWDILLARKTYKDVVRALRQFGKADSIHDKILKMLNSKDVKKINADLDDIEKLLKKESSVISKEFSLLADAEHNLAAILNRYKHRDKKEILEFLDRVEEEGMKQEFVSKLKEKMVEYEKIIHSEDEKHYDEAIFLTESVKKAA